MRGLATAVVAGVCHDWLPTASYPAIARAMGFETHSTVILAERRWRDLSDSTRLAWRQAVNANLPSGVLPV